MQRACDCCGGLYEAQRKTSRYCSRRCSVAYSRGSRPPLQLPTDPAPGPAPSTKVGDALATELQQLKVADSYEGVVALGLARQLDNGTITGAAYVSLSKELDRRVDALRMRADRPGDPAAAAKASVQAKLRVVQ